MVEKDYFVSMQTVMIDLLSIARTESEYAFFWEKYAFSSFQTSKLPFSKTYFLDFLNAR